MKRIVSFMVGIICAVFFTSHCSFAADLYVSKATGVNNNEGTKHEPLKNLQKAVTKAKSGDRIYVAQGNYLGLLDRGYIDIHKTVEIYGGYSPDFQHRDILTYQTTMTPPATTNGTARNKALMEINIPQKEAKTLIIDGFIFDKGDSNGYDKTKGKVEGVSSGMLTLPPFKGDGNIVTNRAPIIRGAMQHGSIIIRNCVLNNGPFQGILLGIDEVHVSILNNIFTSNTICAAEVYERIPSSKPASFEFAYNTVLFNWKERADIKDASYGFGVRFMSGIKVDIHNNIIGFSNLAAIDISRVLTEESHDFTISNNLFCNNTKGELSVHYKKNESTLFALEDFSTLKNFAETSQNRRCKEGNVLKKLINQAYMKEFSSNPAMFANRYPLEDAIKLWGAVKGFGTQVVDGMKK